MDLTAELLLKSPRTFFSIPPVAAGDLEGEGSHLNFYQFLLKMILSRCSDRSPRYMHVGREEKLKLCSLHVHFVHVLVA